MGLSPTVMAALEAAPVPLAAVNREGQILFASPALAELVHRPQGQLSGLPLQTLLEDPVGSQEWQALFSGERRALELSGWRLRRQSDVIPVRLVAWIASDGEVRCGMVHVDPLLEPDLPRGRSVSASLKLLDSVTDALYFLDWQGQIQETNLAGEQLAERPRPAFLGQPIWDVFPELSAEEIRGRLREVAARGLLTEYQLRSPRTGRWLGVRASPSSVGVTVCVRDEQEHHHAEESLREGEAQYRSLFENSLDGVLLSEPGGTIFAANPAACAMFGRGQEELKRLGRRGLFASDDPALGALLDHRRRSGAARGQVTAVRADRTRFPVELATSLFRDARGQERTCMLLRDLSDQKRTEESLRVLAEIGTALGRSLDFNETLQTLTRFLVPRLSDICFVDLLDHDRLERVAVAHRNPEQEPRVKRLRERYHGLLSARGVEAVVRTQQPELIGEVTEGWLRAATRDEGHLRAWRNVGATSMVIVPLLVRGRCLGALTMAMLRGQRPFELRDLAVAQALAERAAMAIDHARLYAGSADARQVRDEMLAIVSHDLRNPLAAIGLHAAVLERKGNGGEAVAIRRALARANRLIEDLLTTAKIEEGKLPLERRSEQLGSVVDEVIELHRALAAERGIDLSAHLQPGLPALAIDRHRVVQLLSNLVGNAIKFTPAGGQVTVLGAQEPNEIRLRVVDTGPGIPPEQMEHLFERFWQGTHARRAGAGLGLAIAKGIAEAHGGRLEVSSQVGRGTAFTFVIPLAAHLQADGDAHPLLH